MLPLMAEEKSESVGDAPKRISRTHRWNPDLLGAIGDYIGAQEVQPTEIATVEAAVREFLAKRGFWPRKARKDRKHNGH